MDKSLDYCRSPKDTTMEMAKRLRMKRALKKISLEELSEIADVSVSEIERFEKNGEIGLFHLIKVSYALGCQNEFDEIFAGSTFGNAGESYSDKGTLGIERNVQKNSQAKKLFR